jgi:ABC-type phosphonate transport system ATPase subunit
MSELRGSNRAADTVANTARDAAPDCAVNAFSTRRIRPGQLAYRFADGLSLETLVLRLETHGYWGEIVGPHGSGKSTLLEHLLPLCEDRGKVVDRFQFRTDSDSCRSATSGADRGTPVRWSWWMVTSSFRGGTAGG